MRSQKQDHLWNWLIGGSLITALSIVSIVIGVQRLTSDVLDSQGLDVPESEPMMEIGGVRRPLSDFQSQADRKRARNSIDDSEPSNNRGFTARKELKVTGERKVEFIVPQVNSNDNPQAAQILEAYTSGTNPERLTPMVAPKPFDLESYQSDPQSYLSTIEPGRVWQAAEPGQDVLVLTAVSPSYQQITQGEAVRLKTIAAKNAPVTFTTFDTGMFQNDLPSITVAADEKGFAEVTYTAPAGTVADVNIGAASPMTSGLLHFRLFVLERASNQ